jgi:predicted amidohydrolase YtcJ
MSGAEGVELRAVTQGPVKVILDDDSLPLLEDLRALIVEAHGRGQCVAVHCVTAAQLVLTLSAFESAGTERGDRVEHAGIVPIDAVPWLAWLGVTVVTQPNFIAERGDQYLEDVDAREHGDLYRCGTLLRAGVPVAAGTDAPFGEPDPWKAVAAAASRQTLAGRTVGAAERIGVDRALALFTGSAHAPGRPRRIAVGQPADLCLLEEPLAIALRRPRCELVRDVVIRGRLVDVPTIRYNPQMRVEPVPIVREVLEA